MGNLSLSSYFSKLAFSTNLTIIQNLSVVPINANTLGFSDLKNYNTSYKLSGTTYFKLPINLNFGYTFYYNQSTFNNSTSSTNRSDLSAGLSYKISETLLTEVTSRFYNIENDHYSFINAMLNYNPENSRFSYRFIANNIFNEKQFTNISISDYTTYISSVDLIPRYFLITAKYRF